MDLSRLMPGEPRPEPTARERTILALRREIETRFERAALRLDGLRSLLDCGDDRDAAGLAALLAEDATAAAGLLGSDAAAALAAELEALGVFPPGPALAGFAVRAEAALSALRREYERRLGRDLAVAADGYRRRALWRARGLIVAVAVLVSAAVLAQDTVARHRRQFAAERLLSRQKTEAAAAVADLAKLAQAAKTKAGKPLWAVTKDVCTRCGCEGRDLRGIPDSDVCAAKWRTALNAMAKAADADPALVERYRRDPWGSPYLLNENEKETPGECAKDTLTSAGPDGTPDTGDDITTQVDNVFCPN